LRQASAAGGRRLVAGAFPGALQGDADVHIAGAVGRLLARLEPLQRLGADIQLRTFAREDNRFSTMAIAEALLFELNKFRPDRAAGPARRAQPGS
jgi:hypothetical protein